MNQGPPAVASKTSIDQRVAAAVATWGRDSFHQGGSIHDCPYNEGEPMMRTAWRQGWLAACDEYWRENKMIAREHYKDDQ